MTGMQDDQVAPCLMHPVQDGRRCTNLQTFQALPVLLVQFDERIAAIVDGDAIIAPGAKLVDLSDKTCLPGLINTHVHLGVLRRRVACGCIGVGIMNGMTEPAVS